MARLPRRKVVGAQQAVVQIRIFFVDVGVNMVLTIVLAAPPLFINRRFPFEVVRVELRNLGKIVVLAMQHVVANFDRLQVAMQPDKTDSQRKRQRPRADPQQATPQHLADARFPPQAADIGNVIRTQFGAITLFDGFKFLLDQIEACIGVAGNNRGAGSHETLYPQNKNKHPFTQGRKFTPRQRCRGSPQQGFFCCPASQYRRGLQAGLQGTPGLPCRAMQNQGQHRSGTSRAERRK